MLKNVVMMQQVHGNNVINVGKNDIGTTIPNCDAMITNDKDVTLGVRTADCLPITIKDKKGLGIGIIHAGWRGLENKIIEKTILKMEKELRVKKEELVIFVGPHICVNHYEVKDDVYSKFKNYPEALIQKDNKTYLDLAKIAQIQLVRTGVLKKNIEINNVCTFENLNLFSFRRGDVDKRNILKIT